MNRAAARSYPFQVIRKFMFNRPGEVFYIGGNDILPAPLSAEREAEVIEMLGTENGKRGKVGSDRAQSTAGGLYCKEI